MTRETIELAGLPRDSWSSDRSAEIGIMQCTKEPEPAAWWKSSPS